ncbi:hypothetical protein ACHAPT_010283 [Fusarium lateritium]
MRDVVGLHDVFKDYRPRAEHFSRRVSEEPAVGVTRFGAQVSELGSYLAEGVKTLRETSKELIELEFNLTSISEAQKSTSTSVSMKRLSWITVRISATLMTSP